MKHLTISSLFILSIMFFKTASYAQKKLPGSMLWKIAAQLPPGNGQAKALGVAGPVAGVQQNALIVAGGSNFPDSMPWQGGKKKYYDEVYVYLKKGLKMLLHKKVFKLPSAIAYAATCSTSSGIVYAGGENENGISNKTLLLQWDAPAENIILKKLPDLPVALTNAAAAVKGNIVYLAGGETLPKASDHFYSLDLDNLQVGWKRLPDLPKPVSHTVLAVQSNGKNACIYLLGGRKKNENGISDLYASVFEFDLEKNQWSAKRSLPYNLCAGTGIAQGRNCILMFGGDKGETFSKVQTLISAINAEKDKTKKQELTLGKNKIQSTHPGFSKEVLQYNTLTDEWVAHDSIPYNTPVTTTAIRWGKDVVIPSGEIRAGVRSPVLLKGKLCR